MGADGRRDSGESREALLEEISRLRAELAEARRSAPAPQDAEERQRLREELRMAQAQLESLREMLSAFFQQAPFPIAISRGANHVYEVANRRYLDLFNRPQLLGRPLREALPEMEPQGIAAIADRVFETGEAFLGQEFPAGVDRRGDGQLEPGYYDFTVAPIRRGDGTVEGLIHTGHEVTSQVAARQRAEQLAGQLEVERTRLEAVLQQMPHGIFIAEAPSGRILFSNERSRQIMGSHAQVPTSVASPAFSACFSAKGQRVLPEAWPLARALRGEAVQGEQLDFLRADGSTVSTEVSAVPVRDAKGHITAAVALWDDVSERLRAQARQARLHAVTSALSQAVTPEQVARVAVAEAQAELSASAGALFVPESGGALRALYAQSFPEGPGPHVPGGPDAPLPPREGVPSGAGGWLDLAAAVAGREVAPASLPAAPRLATWRCIPVPMGARADGGLALGFEAPRTLEEAEQGFLVALAQQVGQALERARLYERLRFSEERFRSLVQASAQAVWTATADGRIVSGSLPSDTFSSLTLEECADDGWLQAVHPEDRERIRVTWAEIVARKQPAELQYRLRRADGEYVPVSVRAVPVLKADGSVREWVGTNTDLSQKEKADFERARLLSELESKERLLRAVLEQMPSGFLLAEGDGRLVYANPQGEAIWGHPLIPAVSVQGYHAFRVSRADGSAYAPEELPMARAVLRGEVVRGEVVWLRRGERDNRFIQVNCAPIRDAEGKTVAAVMVFENITERRRAEQRSRLLASASARLSGSLEYEATLEQVAKLAVPDFADFAAVDLLSDDGQIHRVAITHPAPEKVLQARWVFEHFRPRYEDAAGVGAVIRTGQTEFIPELADALAQPALPVDPEYLAAIQALALCSSITVPMVARGRTLGALTFVMAESGQRYVAADVAVAEELGRRAGIAVDNARLYRDAQEASRLKDEFLSTLSHELRTPLTAILGWSRILQNPALPAERRSHALSVIERNARSQAQLVEDLLDMSRIITGKLRLELEPVDPALVVEASIDSVRPAMEAKGIQLEVALEPLVGRVLGDPGRLQQVVWNLLSNSVKFTPENGWIGIRLSRVGAQVVLEVKDNGQGIEPGFLPFVFDRFRQAEGHSTRRHGGLGLGLAIVRHMVELHGGAVEAQSAGTGQGATFTVRLPTAAAVAPRDRTPPPRPALVALPRVAPLSRAAEPSARLQGACILVVEDEPDSREIVAAALEGSGAKVEGASSAADAIACLERVVPDLVVSDIGMREVDGHELIRRIRSKEAGGRGRLPAIALTAYAREEERARALAAGFDVHLAKPVEPAALVDAVAVLLGRATP